MVWSQQLPIVTQDKPKVLIGTPYRDERLYAWWSTKMLEPLHLQVPWCDKAFQMVRGVPVGVARDTIVEAALADKSITHILWVDADNVCTSKNNPKSPENPNDALQMLLACNQPIVSGLYRAKQATGFNYAMWMSTNTPDGSPGFLNIVRAKDGNWLLGVASDMSGNLVVQRAVTKEANWLQVDAIGMGFCLVQRQVYEKLQRPWYPWITKTPSEDFSFCIAAKKAGFAINVFTDVQLRHFGDLCVNPDGSVQVLET